MWNLKFKRVKINCGRAVTATELPFRSVKVRYAFLIYRSLRSPGRKVTQLKITIFQEKQFNYYIFLIRVLKIEESETANTYVGKKGILHT
jgi:hypothetical protein